MAIKIPVDPFSGNAQAKQSTNAIAMPTGPKETKWGANALVANAAHKMEKSIEKYTEKLDKTAAQDAINELKYYEDQLDNNADTGWTRQTGSKAFEKIDGEDLPARVMSDYDSAAADIRSKLVTPRAKRLYDEYVKTGRADRAHRLDMHMIQAAHDRKQEVDNATLGRLMQDFYDPQKFRSSMTASLDLLQSMVNDNGKAVDLKKILGPSVSDAVASWIDSGNVGAARRVMKDYGFLLSPREMRRNEKAIQAQNEAARTRAIEAKFADKSFEEAAEIIYKDPNLSFKERRSILRAKLEEEAFNDRIQKIKEKKNYKTALDIVESGGEVPISLMSDLPDDMQRNIKLVAYRKRNGIVDQDDIDALEEIEKKSQAEQMAIDFSSYKGRLTDKTISRYQKWQSSAKSDAWKAAENLLDSQIKLNGITSTKTKEQARQALMRGYGEAAELHAKEGGIVPDAEVQSLVSTILTDAGKKGALLTTFSENPTRSFEEVKYDFTNNGGWLSANPKKALSEKTEAADMKKLAELGYKDAEPLIKRGFTADDLKELYLSRTHKDKDGKVVRTNPDTVIARHWCIDYALANAGLLPPVLLKEARESLEKGRPELEIKGIESPSDSQIYARSILMMKEPTFTINQNN